MRYSIDIINNKAVLKLYNTTTSISYSVDSLTPESVHRLMCSQGDGIENVFGIDGLKCLMLAHWHVCEATKEAA